MIYVILSILYCLEFSFKKNQQTFVIISYIIDENVLFYLAYENNRFPYDLLFKQNKCKKDLIRERHLINLFHLYNAFSQLRKINGNCFPFYTQL